MLCALLKRWLRERTAVVLPPVSVEELVVREECLGAYQVTVVDVHEMPCGLSRCEVQPASRVGLLASARDRTEQSLRSVP